MEREYAVEVEWVPFELHPETPTEGCERESRSKAGHTGMRDHLHQVAEEAGLPLKSNRIVSNAHKSLEAGEWAREQGTEAFDAVHRAFFAAYFAEARNISTVDQVVDALAGTDLGMGSLREALEAGSYAGVVDQMTTIAREQGISSTPTFIFERQFVINGAHDFEVFADVLDRIGVPRREGVAPGPLRDAAISRQEARGNEAAADNVVSLDDI